MLENTKQDRDHVFRDNIEKNFVSLMCLAIKMQKAKND